MRQGRLLTIAAGAVATIALAGSPSAPAHAVTIGEGAVVGSIAPCVGGQTTITFDSPAFQFDGHVGALHASGPSDCLGGSLLVDGGSDLAVDVTGPGFACSDLGGAWTRVGAELRLIVGGPCTFTGGAGPRNMQLLVEGALAAGTLAGAVVVY